MSSLRFIIRRLKYIFGANDPGDFWDIEYKEGNWDYLGGIEESARYSIISGLFSYFNDHKYILDLGCGEGILVDYMCIDDFNRYIGVDISEEAINRALDRESECISFFNADIKNFKTDDKFDIIIINECLQYVGNPVGIIDKYKDNLSRDGKIIVSLYSTAITFAIWSVLRLNYDSSYSFNVKNKDGYKWKIKIYEKTDL